MTKQILGETSTGYRKIVTDNDNIQYQAPDGRFCKKEAYYGSKGGNRDNDIDLERNAQETEDRLGITPDFGGGDIPRKKETDIENIEDEWKEEEGKNKVQKEETRSDKE